MLCAVLLGLLAGASALVQPSQAESQLVVARPSDEHFLLELEPGKTVWALEEQKWELKRNGVNFMDITDHPDLGTQRMTEFVKPRFPTAVAYNETLNMVFPLLSKQHLFSDLTTLTSFQNRYYKSEFGRNSSEWLYHHISKVVRDSGATKYGATVRKFKHSWPQSSIIVRIPGKSKKMVVIGAHQDSANYHSRMSGIAPGADDDGSGTVTILEALRVLLMSQDVVEGKADNTIEFHWYAAEEGGLLGSQAIFSEYEKSCVDVRAMMQQDMTGYTQGMLTRGIPLSIGVMTDFVDPDLTDFVKLLVVEYTDLPWREGFCKYGCSDHASANKAGYPSSFVAEAPMGNMDWRVHTTEDKIEFLDFDHMIRLARVALAFAFELGFTDL